VSGAGSVVAGGGSGGFCAGADSCDWRKDAATIPFGWGFANSSRHPRVAARVVI